MDVATFYPRIMAVTLLFALVGCSMSSGGTFVAEQPDHPCHPSQGPGLSERSGTPAFCEFLYYPESEIYLNKDAGVYHWRGDGKTWYWGDELSEDVELRGEPVEVRLDTNMPAQRHRAVRKRYGPR